MLLARVLFPFEPGSSQIKTKEPDTTKKSALFLKRFSLSLYSSFSSSSSFNQRKRRAFVVSPSRADSKRARREASCIKEREEEVKNLLSVYIVVFSRENAGVESKKENNIKRRRRTDF